MDDATRLNQLAADLSPLITARFMDSGTWTPTYLGDVTAGVTTYVGAGTSGYWYRVGSVVTVIGRVEWTAATGAGTGIVSLPFISSSATNQEARLAVAMSNIVFSGYVTGAVFAGQSVMVLISTQSNVAASLVPIDTNGGLIGFSGTYVI